MTDKFHITRSASNTRYSKCPTCGGSAAEVHRVEEVAQYLGVSSKILNKLLNQFDVRRSFVNFAPESDDLEAFLSSEQLKDFLARLACDVAEGLLEEACDE